MVQFQQLEKPAIGGPSGYQRSRFSESRTAWLALQCRSHPSPRDFPAIREFNWEFCNSEAFGDGFGARNRCAAATYRATPYSLTGKLFRGQGFLVQQQGIYLQIYNRNDDALSAGRKAVMGALSLYLNFINLFMLMLRLAGVRFAPVVSTGRRNTLS
jgi:hypothetical protein